MVDRRHVFDKFASEAEKELGDRLKHLVLYGSVSRGEDTEGSDIDVFAVVQSKQDLELLEDIAFEVGVIENGVFISVQGQEEKRFKDRRNHPFITRVFDEGDIYV